MHLLYVRVRLCFRIMCVCVRQEQANAIALEGDVRASALEAKARELAPGILGPRATPVTPAVDESKAARDRRSSRAVESAVRMSQKDEVGSLCVCSCVRVPPGIPDAH